MSNRTASPTLISRPAPPRARRASFSHPGWGLRRVHPGWWPLPSTEEVEERLRNYRGFVAHLTPEQIAAMDACDGPEVLGNPYGPKRTF
ncbi:MAG TPA: hypothetical protein VFR37_25415 [Longimicrobium sp.]|nr:hypothetical protein [Longimicrobium sp.]